MLRPPLQVLGELGKDREIFYANLSAYLTPQPLVNPPEIRILKDHSVVKQPFLSLSSNSLEEQKSPFFSQSPISVATGRSGSAGLEIPLQPLQARVTLND